ncbi:hypothetical protein ALC60_12914 [Trachymyrmex zeteki]|uniref:Uncharacterized protein n=1 Tax=Mycetomoellerius zeteki TaxID=64791 RepID=A0A151WJS9_9HYME|nr:hypothetical protein ALC60_12914 [Trachymyrmex zeteki]
MILSQLFLFLSHPSSFADIDVENERSTKRVRLDRRGGRDRAPPSSPDLGGGPVVAMCCGPP